jgi:cytochrome P450
MGSAQGFLTDIVGTFVDAWRECGDVVWLRAPRPMYVLAHPDSVQHVFDEHHEHHPRSGYVRKMNVNIMGRGLFTVDDDEWRQLYPLVTPPFASDHVARYARVMAGETAAMLARWEGPVSSGQPLEIPDEMMRMSLDVMGRLAYGDDWQPEAEAVRRAVLDMTAFSVPRVTGFPTPVELLKRPYRLYRAAMRTVDGFTDRVAAARRREPADDLVTAFVQARDDGRTLTDEQIRDAVRMALFGEFKGPALALTWVWYLLSRHPDVRRRLHAELDAELGGRAPTPDDLPRLEYTRRIVLETLRLYPTLWLMSRPPREAEVIGGYQIPKRVYLIVMPYITHRHPDFWDNPEAFDPDRFSPERSAGRHPYAYIPFGRAHRACIGEAYSLLQLRLTTAMVAQRYVLDVFPGQAITRKTEYLLRPARGLTMNVRERGNLRFPR